MPDPVPSRSRRLVLWEGIDDWRAEAVTMELDQDGLVVVYPQLARRVAR